MWSFAYPIHATFECVSSGAFKGWPEASVTMTPSSVAINAQLKSYGWQQSPAAAGVWRLGVSGRKSATNRSCPGHQFVKLAARGNVLILETLRLSRIRGPSAAPRLRHRSPPGRRALPGKNRAIIANPWAMVSDVDGRNWSGESSPRDAIVPLRATPPGPRRQPTSGPTGVA